LLKPDVVICLGNEILSDDSFGYHVAERLCSAQGLSDTDVIFAPLAGFGLLDLINRRRRVLIVDTIVSGKDAPGTIRLNPLGVFTPSYHLTTSHQMNLPTTLEFGKTMGMEMPERIDVLTVEASDVETLSEHMTPAVDAAVGPSAERILAWASEAQLY
jgi:hydrogenase maturation protease